MALSKKSLFTNSTGALLLSLLITVNFRRRVHFALRRIKLKPPIARLPEIVLDFINRPNGEKDCIYEARVK